MPRDSIKQRQTILLDRVLVPDSKTQEDVNSVVLCVRFGVVCQAVLITQQGLAPLCSESPDPTGNLLREPGIQPGETIRIALANQNNLFLLCW